MEEKLENLESSIDNLETALENVWWKHQANPKENDFDKFWHLCDGLLKKIQADFKEVEAKK